MQRRKATGICFIEILMIVAIILLIASITLPSVLDWKNKYMFRDYFGVEAPAKGDEDAIAAQTPLVNKRIADMEKAINNAILEAGYADSQINKFLKENGASTPASAKNALAALRQLRENRENADLKLGIALRDFSQAKAVASHFGFSFK